MKDYLMRGTYEHLPLSEKQHIFSELGKRHNMKLKELTTFSRWGITTESAVFEYEDSEFVFVPGDTVTLGWNCFSQGMDNDTRNELLDELNEFGLDITIEEFLDSCTSPVRQVTIGPMLVERKFQEYGYERVDIDSPLITGNKNWMEGLENAKKQRYNSINFVGDIRFSCINEKWVADICHNITYEQLLDSLNRQGFSLPTFDEWEYLCGGGCRTLFPWGDSFDFSMKLHHFCSDKNTKAPYDLEQPNFFGLSIGFDPYKLEILESDNSSVVLQKGGDGGCNICGGTGVVLGYLPCSPYFIQEEDMYSEINNDYNFIRRIIRLKE